MPPTILRPGSIRQINLVKIAEFSAGLQGCRCSFVRAVATLFIIERHIHTVDLIDVIIDICSSVCQYRARDQSPPDFATLCQTATDGRPETN